MLFEGTWNIYEMDMWSEDYFNMECQAYISINHDGSGDFQFGLVYGNFNGKLCDINRLEVFKFRFFGTDESEETSGEGWIKIDKNNSIVGVFSFDDGDSSEFHAKLASI